MAGARCSATVGALFLALGVAKGTAQQPLNLDFEMSGVSGADRPWGWSAGWSAFAAGSGAAFSLDTALYHRGKKSLRIAATDSVAEPQAIMLQLPAGFARGKALRVSGWIRRDRPEVRALLTLEAWKDRAFAAADTAVVGPSAAGGGAWASVDLAMRVPNDSTIHSIVITSALATRGSAWFDDLQLFVNGVRLQTLPVDPPPPTASNRTWLAARATPISGVRIDSVSSPADLAVARIVGDAQVVALGESTHGTSEFFLMKARLIAFLVREHNFRVLAIEANQIAAERINRYVMYGEGTSREVIRSMFKVWNTEEVLELLEWLRAWNVVHPDQPVRFAGFDMQDHKRPVDSLRAFLQRTDPKLVRRVDSLVGEYQSQASSATPHIVDSTRARWARQAEALWWDVSGRRRGWLTRAQTGADSVAVEWAVQCANLVRQSAGFNVELSSPQRDSLMAANATWLLRTITPGQRAVIWAHDVHISHGGDAKLSFNGGAQMGAHLKREFGTGYRALTLLTASGGYSATASFVDHRIIEAAAFPAPVNSWEGVLHALSRPPGSIGVVVDLRTGEGQPGAQWTQVPRPIRHIGYAAYDYGFEFKAVLPLEFDGAVFIDRTTASRVLQ